MDLGETGWSGVGWVGLARDGDRWRALVSAGMSLRFPYNTGEFSSVFITSVLSSTALCSMELGSWNK
jgi:hypothetical protein